METLERFIKAQEVSYEKALSEMRSGKKQSHWMWYIFPQLKQLGKTDIARFYGIEDLKEATDYLNHPILGKRLTEISEALLEVENDNPREVMGKPDDLKLRSCMTLFKQVKDSPEVFQKVLNKFYNGEQDELTMNLLDGKQI